MGAPWRMPSPRRSAGPTIAPRGLWDDTTLAGRVAAHAAGPPDAVGGRRRRGAAPAHLRRARRRRRRGSRRGSTRPRASAPATSSSVQLPNRYETVVAAVAVQSLGAVINPLLPNYRARELAHVFTTARPCGRLHAGATTGASTTSRWSREVAAATGVAPVHVVRRRPARRRSTSRRSTSCIAVDGGALRPGAGACRSRLRADLHVGHRGDAQGDHAHRADDELQRARRALRPRHHRRRRRVDAVARRPLDRLQLRLALRAVPRPAARAAGPVGPGQAAVELVAARAVQLHAGRHHVPAGPGRGRRAAPAAGSTSLRCFGCGGRASPARRSSTPAAGQGIQCCGSTARPRCSSARGTGPSRRSSSACSTDGIAMSHVEVEIRRRRRPAVRARARPARSSSAAPTRASASSPTPSATAATFDPTAGCAAATSRRLRRRTATSPWSGRKKEIIIRGGINIAPREIEELIVALARGRPCRGGRCARRPPRRAQLRVRRAAPGRGARRSRRWSSGSAPAASPRTSCPSSSRSSTRFPTTASGKVQKHEIVRGLAGEPTERTRER